MWENASSKGSIVNKWHMRAFLLWLDGLENMHLRQNDIDVNQICVRCIAVDYYMFYYH